MSDDLKKIVNFLSHAWIDIGDAITIADHLIDTEPYNDAILLCLQKQLCGMHVELKDLIDRLLFFFMEGENNGNRR